MGVSPMPTSTNHNSTPKVNIFVKTKKVQKCKIKHNLFSHKHGVPKRGGGGRGGLRLGKNSHIFPFLFFGNVPKVSVLDSPSLVLFPREVHSSSLCFTLSTQNKKLSCSSCIILSSPAKQWSEASWGQTKPWCGDSAHGSERPDGVRVTGTQ